MRKVNGFKQAQSVIYKIAYQDYEATLEELVQAKRAFVRQINLFNRKEYKLGYDTDTYETGINVLIDDLNFIDNYLSSVIGYIRFENLEL